MAEAPPVSTSTRSTAEDGIIARLMMLPEMLPAGLGINGMRLPLSSTSV